MSVVVCVTMTVVVTRCDVSRVLALATRVLGRGGFCRHEVVGGDGDESDPKTL
jgi:hypothetical protein